MKRLVNYIKSHPIVFVFGIALFVRVLLAPSVWHPDLNNHVDWGIRFWEYGPKNFYSANVWNYTWPNQPPGTIYMFAGVRKIYELEYNIFWWVNTRIQVFPSSIMTSIETNGYQALLKYPAIFSDIGIAFCIYYVFKSGLIKVKSPNRLGLVAASLYLFNPAVVYNSAVWGQYDSVINFLAILSFVFLFQRKLFVSVFLLLLSFYIKASLLIFLPFYLLAVLKLRFDLRKAIGTFLLCFFLFVIATTPFVSKVDSMSYLVSLYTDKVFKDQLQIITANAFNLWTIIAGINQQPQSLLLGPFTYQLWGQILFVFSLIPLTFASLRKLTFEKIVWVLGLTAFSSFMLLTNMHERYLFPLFPYLAIMVALNKKLFGLFAIICGINLLNLYNYWFTPKIDFIVSIFNWNDHLVTRFFSLIMFIVFVKMMFMFIHSLNNKSAFEQ